MDAGWTVLLLAIGYLGLLFAIAAWGDRRGRVAQALISSPLVYTLSLAVYCTAWTFYGSVGLAASQGFAFLPTYLGPTLASIGFLVVLRKIVRITKAYGLTSIADFISARYGKSWWLGGLVTVVAVIAAIPYISLQLKAVAVSIDVTVGERAREAAATFGADTALIVTLVLAAFSILFGTRHVDATENHRGMVLAIAFESLVKLVCFVLVGAVITLGLLAMPDAPAASEPIRLDGAFLFSRHESHADWFLLILLAGLAFIVLPRQFQVAVIENVDERHLARASWLLPLYLLLINIFVLPIAVAGLQAGVPIERGDQLVLLLPIMAGADWLMFVAFVGGLSAATAMVIVETIALSTMISNDVFIPTLLKANVIRVGRQSDLANLVLMIRRAGILVILLLSYLFFRTVANNIALVSIGLISFVAIVQLAPALLIGLFWKEGNLAGAASGIVAGMVIWAITLIVPMFAAAGMISPDLVTNGLFGIELFKPEALFGFSDLSPVPHSLFWSLSVNTGLFVLLSLVVRQTTLERLQAIMFVDVDRSRGATRSWQGEAKVGVLRDLLVRFIGSGRAHALLAVDASRRGRALAMDELADADLVQLAERQLGRAIGSASARVVVGSAVHREEIGPNELMEILDETSRTREYSRQLEQKSRALQEATEELRAANERLLEVGRLKDEFLATVSHELRTPLTSIRSFSEILYDSPDLSQDERRQFLEIVINESHRLTRLINDVLDLAKIESGRIEWHEQACNLRALIDDAIAASRPLVSERGIKLDVAIENEFCPVSCDGDRIVQVLINLLSNAAKFAPVDNGRIEIGLEETSDCWRVRVEDNGQGIPREWRETVFDKFRQLATDNKGKPQGTGLGLAISRQIVSHFGGRIWVEDARLGGAAFCFTLPKLDARERLAVAGE